MKKLEEIKQEQHFADIEFVANDLAQPTNNPMNQPTLITNNNDKLVPVDVLNTASI